MKSNRSCTIDDIALFLGRGCALHPLLYDYYHDQLDYLVYSQKVSLVPFTIFEKFHRKLAKVA